MTAGRRPGKLGTLYLSPICQLEYTRNTKQTYVIHMFYFYYGGLMAYALVSG